MSTVIDDIQEQEQPSHEIPVTLQYQNEDGSPNVALLQDRTPEQLMASSAVTLLTGVLGVMFVLLSYFRLWHTDLWGHLSYGKWIATHGQLPSTEPLMPLAKGVPMIDTAWLSQLIGYFTIEQFGATGIQFLYAASITFVAATLAFTLYARTRQPWIALLSVVLFYWCDYQQLLIVRPQLAGLACFAAVFAMASSFRWRRWYLFAIPVVFALWANLHGSFIVGLAMLGALTVGRAIDVLRRTRSVKSMLAESRVQQLFVATELAAVAVLLNPYGIAIYPEVLTFSNHPNLASLVEWDPLTLRMKQGQAAFVMALTLIGLYRLSPRRVTSGEVLLMLGLGGGALWTSRLIVWWAPVAAYYFGLHGAAVWRTWMEARPRQPRRGGLYSVSILGMLWICFAYTPFGASVIHGGPTSAEEARKQFESRLSKNTPLEATKYLREHPPQGLVFNTYEWGDFLLWDGPDNLQLFVASHVHLVPEEVWQHYLLISSAGPTWDTKLDRYGVNALVLKPSRHGALVQALEEQADTWNKAYESNNTVVFERKNPI